MPNYFLDALIITLIISGIVFLGCVVVGYAKLTYDVFFKDK